jgi:hypothetical protein
MQIEALLFRIESMRTCATSGRLNSTKGSSPRESISRTLVPERWIQKERLMASTLYQSIIKEGEERGEARNKAETVIRVLAHRLGALDPAIRKRIREVSDVETLSSWYEEALFLVDAEGARRLAEKIQKAPLPSPVT